MEKKIVIVTGASGNLGKAVVKKFLVFIMFFFKSYIAIYAFRLLMVFERLLFLKKLTPPKL